MVRLFFVVALLNLLVCNTIYFYLPSFRDTMIGEDMIVENTTAIIFLIAALFSLVYLFKYKTRGFRSLLIFTMLFGLIACLDEISFGERYFKLTMPVLANKKIDGLHDFIKLGYSLTVGSLKHIPKPVLLVIPLLLIIGITLLVKQRAALWSYIYVLFNKNKLNFIMISKAFSFLLICGSLIALAMLIDLGIVHSPFISFLEELFEMNASLALFFCVFTWYKEVMALHINYVIPSANNFEKNKRKSSTERVVEELN